MVARADVGGRLGIGVPPAGPGVCAMCHGPARDGRPVCWCCRSVSAGLGPTPGATPLVVPVALYRTGDRLHRVLRGYKDAPAVTARRHFTRCIATHLSAFLSTHGPCIARAAGAGWDSVAVVPSSTRRPAGRRHSVPLPEHPLGRAVTALPCLSGLSHVVIGGGPATAGHLAPAAGAFEVGDGLEGRHVLLLDDSWVTGARGRSAAVALDRAGAEVVAIVVAGRAVGAVDAAPVPAVATWWRWAEAREDQEMTARARCCVSPCVADLSM